MAEDQLDPIAARVVAALDDHGIAHEVMECDPALADTAAFCEHYGVPPADSANTIVVASRKPEGHAVVCVVLATHRLDVNRTVRTRMGVRKASFAPADATRDLTGMEIGGVTPVAIDPGLPIWIDGAVFDRDSVVIGGGSRSWKIRLSPEDLLRLPGTERVDGLAAPAP